MIDRRGDRSTPLEGMANWSADIPCQELRRNASLCQVFRLRPRRSPPRGDREVVPSHVAALTAPRRSSSSMHALASSYGCAVLFSAENTRYHVACATDCRTADLPSVNETFR